MIRLLQNELTVVVGAYLLAGIPIGAMALLGQMDPSYHMSRAELLRWWSWAALAIVAVSVFLGLVTR